MNPLPLLRLAPLLVIGLGPACLKAERIDLNIPVALDGFGMVKTPFALEVESYPIADGKSGEKSPERIKAALTVALDILDAARKGSFERFAKLSTPGLEDQALRDQFNLFKGIMSKIPDLSLRRCFGVGTQLVFTAIFPSGRESAAVLLQDKGKGAWTQNLALSFEPVPQTILYALKEAAVARSGGADLNTDSRREVKIKLYSEQETNGGVAVMIKTGELYARGVQTNEIAFTNKYGCSIQSLLDGYFGACEGIGTASFESNKFSAKSLTRIKPGMMGHKRPAENERIDFVSPLSDRLFMLLTCPEAGRSTMIGFVSFNGKDTQVLNFATTAKIEELFALPDVKTQLVDHWKKLKNPKV